MMRLSSTTASPNTMAAPVELTILDTKDESSSWLKLPLLLMSRLSKSILKN